MHNAIRYTVRHVEQHHFRLYGNALSAFVKSTRTLDLKLSTDTIHIPNGVLIMNLWHPVFITHVRMST